MLNEVGKSICVECQSFQSIFENQPTVLDHSSLQDSLPWDSSKQISGEAKVYSPEGKSCLASFSQDHELYYLTVRTAKANPKQFFLACKVSGLGENHPQLAPLTPVPRSCYQCTAEISWVACALVCCLLPDMKVAEDTCEH